MQEFQIIEVANSNEATGRMTRVTNREMDYHARVKSSSAVTLQKLKQTTQWLEMLESLANITRSEKRRDLSPVTGTMS